MRSTGESNLKRAKIKCEAMSRIAEEEARGDVSRELLEHIVNDTLHRLGHEPVKAPTVRGFLEGWLTNQRGAVAPLTHSRYAQVLRDFLATLGSRAEAKLTSITEVDILRYRDWLLSGGRSPQTVNNTLRDILKSPFRIAVESGLLERNPVLTVAHEYPELFKDWERPDHVAVQVTNREKLNAINTAIQKLREAKPTMSYNQSWHRLQQTNPELFEFDEAP